MVAGPAQCESRPLVRLRALTADDWQGTGDREQPWRDRLSLAGDRHVVAWQGERACGMVSGVPGEHRKAALISVGVAPSCRGRGVGDALVDDIVQWASAASSDLASC